MTPLREVRREPLCGSDSDNGAEPWNPGTAGVSPALLQNTAAKMAAVPGFVRPFLALFGFGVRMTDAMLMRLQLQQVAAYRELCRGVRRSGRDNVGFALLMLFIAYLAYDAGAPLFTIAFFCILAVGELLVGLFKWFIPSAEGVLLDGLVLLVFAGYNILRNVLQINNGVPASPLSIFLGLWLLFNAFGRFKAYGQLRKLFAERPSAEHMVWFDELIRDVRASDAQSDELALDLPTKPQWKVKLLGTTVFFVATRGHTVWVCGPEDFELMREKTDHGTGRRRALLSIYGVPHPEFEIADASWANYQKWRAVYPASQPA